MAIKALARLKSLAAKAKPAKALKVLGPALEANGWVVSKDHTEIGVSVPTAYEKKGVTVQDAKDLIVKTIPAAQVSKDKPSDRRSLNMNLPGGESAGVWFMPGKVVISVNPAYVSPFK